MLVAAYFFSPQNNLLFSHRIVTTTLKQKKGTDCYQCLTSVSSPLVSRERQAKLSGVGGDRLQHASHHHLHETHEAAVHEQQQGT